MFKTQHTEDQGVVIESNQMLKSNLEKEKRGHQGTKHRYLIVGHGRVISLRKRTMGKFRCCAEWFGKNGTEQTLTKRREEKNDDAGKKQCRSLFTL